MPSFIRPTSKIVMEEFSSWRPCLGCFHSSRRCLPTAGIKDRNLRKRLQKFFRISTLKSSNVPIRSADLWSCPNAGSSSARLRGSIAAEGLPRIGRISTERRSRSCASPQSASCSENSAIRPEVSGQTLRVEDEKPEPETHDVSGEGEGGHSVHEDGGTGPNGEAVGDGLDGEDEDGDDHKPLSDILIRDLTAHRTLGLRLALREQPEVAIVAVIHALSAQIFYRGADAPVLDIRPVSTMLASHADGIEDTKAGKAWQDHHARWAAQMPRDVTDLWTFVVELDHDSRMALFAHCVALTVNAVKLPMDRRPRAIATADRLAEAVSLDMTAHWRPTARTYFGRVTKPRILHAEREADGNEAADRMADMKKQDMAEADEQLLAATGWLPALLRTPEPARLVGRQPEAPETADAEEAARANDDGYPVAAE